VEELDGADTPLEHMSRQMKGATPSAVRAQLGRFGFSADKATTEVRKLSGGERARLALALITREAPHLLILDEPTNHLDVDSREALVQALNEYSGAVVLVSHDRHMIELTADRLVLVHDGTAQEYDGSLEDYTTLILQKDNGRAASAPKANRKDERRAAAAAREKSKALRTEAKAAEAEIQKLAAQRSAVDQAMFDPSTASAGLSGLTMTQLMKRRAEIEAQLAKAEARWLNASEAVESAEAA
jgi:ATP-binding cassette subfamily F protein 3